MMQVLGPFWPNIDKNDLPELELMSYRYEDADDIWYKEDYKVLLFDNQAKRAFLMPTAIATHIFFEELSTYALEMCQREVVLKLSQRKLLNCMQHEYSSLARILTSASSAASGSSSDTAELLSHVRSFLQRIFTGQMTTSMCGCVS